MALDIKLFCSMCGKEKWLELKDGSVADHTTLAQVIEQSKWIWQQNGVHLDIYCCKRCAK